MMSRSDSPRPIVAFRVNGSEEIGFGHIGRCRNLAAAFDRLGYSCRFVRTGIRDVVLDDHDVVWIDVDDRHVGGPQDADMTLAAATAEGESPSVVIVDDYTIGPAWEGRIKESGVAVVAIDDLADRPHDCDVLIDSNPLPQDRYRGLVGPDTLCLIGPQYALLDVREGLADVKRLASNHGVDRVFVCFGGGSHPWPIRMVLEASRDRRFDGLRFEIVTADDDLARSFTEEAHRFSSDVSTSNVKFWGWVTDLNGFLENCDVAIGAGGSLALERIRRGIPSIVMSVAENQIEASSALGKQGLLRYLGEYTTCTASRIADALAELVKDEKFRRGVELHGPRIYDGYGALRCATAIDAAISRCRRGKEQGIHPSL